jgi:hypothetical protein
MMWVEVRGSCEAEKALLVASHIDRGVASRFDGKESS